MAETREEEIEINEENPIDIDLNEMPEEEAMTETTEDIVQSDAPAAIEFEKEPEIEEEFVPEMVLVPTVKRTRKVTDSVTKKRKRCKKGRRRNPKTRRCNKKCPPGYKKNATNKRCIKIRGGKKKSSKNK